MNKPIAFSRPRVAEMIGRKSGTLRAWSSQTPPRVHVLDFDALGIRSEILAGFALRRGACNNFGPLSLPRGPSDSRRKGSQWVMWPGAD
jgi:hypothetical protein